MLFEVPFSGKSSGLERKKKRQKSSQAESEILRAETGGSHTAYLEGFQRHTLPWWCPQISKGRVVGVLVPQATSPNSKSSKPHRILWSLSSRVIKKMTIQQLLPVISN